MEDAKWDGASESSFELVEAPDVRVISSPDLSPAPSLHEDGFEALEAGSPCSSSGSGATAVLERSLCFPAAEEEAGVQGAVSACSRASSMDGYPAAETDLGEDCVDCARPPAAPAGVEAPAAATGPAPEELPAAAGPTSNTPAAVAALGDDAAGNPAQAPSINVAALPSVTSLTGKPTTTAAAAAAGTNAAALLEGPAEAVFWATPAGMRLYAALSGTAAAAPASARAAAPPAAAPAPKATAVVTLAVVLVSMGAILVSVGRTSHPHVEVATSCAVLPHDTPLWSRCYAALHAPWDQLQSNASSQLMTFTSSRTGAKSGASSNASFATGKDTSWGPLSLEGWPMHWRPFKDWPCSLAAVAAAVGGGNISNWTIVAAIGNVTLANTRRQALGGALGRRMPCGDSWSLPHFLGGVRDMWGLDAHANWSMWRNVTPSVTRVPTTPHQARLPHSAEVPRQEAGEAVLLPWLPGMPLRVWFKRHLFQAAGGHIPAAFLPLMHANASGLSPPHLAAVCWNVSSLGARAGRPARAAGRQARPLPPWYLPTPPCYSLQALSACTAGAGDAAGTRLFTAMAKAQQAALACYNCSLGAAAATSKHRTAAAAAASASTMDLGATAGVRAAAAAGMPAAQPPTAAVPEEQQQQRQGAPMSGASSSQDHQQQQLALEAVRELVGGVLQRLRHMQQQHSGGSWGRILDLLPPHFVVELQQVANTTQALLSHLALPTGLQPPASAPVVGTPAGGGTSAAGGASGTANASTQGNATRATASEGTAADLQAGVDVQCALGHCKVSHERPGGLMGYVMGLAAMAPASSSSRGFLMRRPTSTGLVLAQPRHVMPVHTGAGRATCDLPDTTAATNLRDAPPHVLRAVLQSTLSLPAAKTPLRHDTSPAAAAREEAPAAQQGAAQGVPAAAPAPAPPPTALHFMALPPAPREAHPRLAPAAVPQAVALPPAETRYVLVERQGLLQGLVAVPQLPESEQLHSAEAFPSGSTHDVILPAVQGGTNGSHAVEDGAQHGSTVNHQVDGLGLGGVPAQARPRASAASLMRPCAGAVVATLSPSGASTNHTTRTAPTQPHVPVFYGAHAWRKEACAGAAAAAAGRLHASAPAAAAPGQQAALAARTARPPAARRNGSTRGPLMAQHSEEQLVQGLPLRAKQRMQGGASAASVHAPLPSTRKQGAGAAMPAAAASTAARPGHHHQEDLGHKDRPSGATRRALWKGSTSDHHPQQQQQPQAARRQAEVTGAYSSTEGRRQQQQRPRQQRQKQPGPSQRGAPSSPTHNGSTRRAEGESSSPHRQQQARHKAASEKQQHLGCDCLDVMAPWEQVMRSVSAASLARMHAACSTQQNLLQRLARTSHAASKRLQRHLHRWKRTLHTQGWHPGDWEHSWGAAEEWLGASGTGWAAWVSDMQRWTHPVCDAAKQLQLLHARWQSRCKHCSIYDAPAARKRRASQVSLCDCSTCCNWAQPILDRLLDSQPAARLILNQLSRFSGPGQRSVGAWWRHLQQLSMQGGPEFMRAFQRAWGHKGLPLAMHQALQDLLQLLAQLPDQEAAA